MTDQQAGDLAGLDDLELARKIAYSAGRLLVDLRNGFDQSDADGGIDRKALRDEGDRRSNEFIVEAINSNRPADAVLSEEAVDLEDRDQADRVWIVDPLDGTWEYGQGRDDFAVHIALWERGSTAPSSLTVGIVDLPNQNIARTTGDDIRPHGIPKRRPIRIVTSRTRAPEGLEAAVAQVSQQVIDSGINEFGVEVRTVGSVGAKVSEVLAGRAEGYLHDSGFYEWDVAAPLAVARHYGLVATHYDGSEITFNNRPTWVTDLVVMIPELTEVLLPLRQTKA